MRVAGVEAAGDIGRGDVAHQLLVRAEALTHVAIEVYLQCDSLQSAALGFRFRASGPHSRLSSGRTDLVAHPNGASLAPPRTVPQLLMSQESASLISAICLRLCSRAASASSRSTERKRVLSFVLVWASLSRSALMTVPMVA